MNATDSPSKHRTFTDRFLHARGKGFFLLCLAQLHALLVFIIFLSFAIPTYSTINTALTEEGINIDAVLIIFLAWSVLMAYAIILCTRAIIQLRKNVPIKPVRFNAIFPFCITIIFTLIYIAILFTKNMSIGSILHPVIFAGVLLLTEATVALVVLAVPAASILRQIRKKGAAVLVLTIYAGIMIVPYLALPSNVLPGALPPKPQFVAHRGSFAGPENTIEGAVAIHQFDVIGWEIDIRISIDGQFFLMHDDTLFRTTNVAEHFPGREFEPAENFTLSELRELDVGSKFLASPCALIARQYVNQTILDIYPGAKIATLDEAIAKSVEYGWMIDADMKSPPVGHPFKAQFDGMVLDKLVNSSVPHVWFGGHLELTQPNIVHYANGIDTDPAVLFGIGYDIGFFELYDPAAAVRRYSTAGYPVYMQIVDDAVSFSHAWAVGCTYVLTDTPYLYQNMAAPVWYMPSWAWYLSWMLLHALAGILVAGDYLRKKGKQEPKS
nr:glycerophosphodiester phosphodiesterase family protein [Candidatus Sigynarchaeota archaeon]